MQRLLDSSSRTSDPDFVLRVSTQRHTVPEPNDGRFEGARKYAPCGLIVTLDTDLTAVRKA